MLIRYAQDAGKDFDIKVKITCDRCGKTKPLNTDGLGWITINRNGNGQTNICPECIEDEEERCMAVSNVKKFINIHIWAKSSVLKRIQTMFRTEQRQFEKDCDAVISLMKQLDYTQNIKFFRSYLMGKSQIVSNEMIGMFKDMAAPIICDDYIYLWNTPARSMLVYSDRHRLFIAENQSDYLAMYWFAMTRFREFGLANSHTWKQVARHALERISNHPNVLIAIRPQSEMTMESIVA